MTEQLAAEVENLTVEDAAYVEEDSYVSGYSAGLNAAARHIRAARTADPGGLRELTANRQVPDENRITITVGELRAALASETTAP